jgi:hypothetical protein
MGSRIVSVSEGALTDFEGELSRLTDALPSRVNADPEKVEQGLAKLVLTLIELLRGLLEKQAMRRVEASSLSDEEIENVGETLMKLENKMEELKQVFGLKDEELNLNLGPLGDLM